MRPIFRLSAERKVPILIHGGRGLPPIAAHLHALVESCGDVQLIVAHAVEWEEALKRRNS